jgi:hypothetical protein
MNVAHSQRLWLSTARDEYDFSLFENQTYPAILGNELASTYLLPSIPPQNYRNYVFPAL